LLVCFQPAECITTCGTLNHVPDFAMLVQTPPARLLRFDNFELDTRAGELRKGGIKLRLQGQPLQVLATLMERAGDLVTREQLRAQLWPADTFVDFDHSLHNAIARIRAVLGDCAEQPRYIETMPRRGYRFIAAVEVVGVSQPELDAKLDPPHEVARPSPPTTRHNLRLIVPIALSVLVVAACTLWYIRWSSHPAAVTLPLHSIAVLPLENLSGDPSQEYLVAGMTEELTTDLAKISSLRVTSRTSAMRYKGTKKALPQIARELNVDGIIEGSVVRSGNRVRVTAQLLFGPADQHIWAETYDRDFGDVLRLQAEVAQTIAQQVQVQVSPQQQVRFRSAPQVQPDAYDDYLKGRFHWVNAFSHRDDLTIAKKYFEDSIRRDPHFADAYIGLADVYMYLGFFHQLSPENAYRPAVEALRKALEIDGNIAAAHDTLAVLSWRYEWNWPGAEREFANAIALDPTYPCAHEDYSLFLALNGHRSEALSEFAKGRELNPDIGALVTELGDYYQLRDYARLVEAGERGVASNPTEWLVHYYLGIGYQKTGKPLEAISEYKKAVALSGGDQDATAALVQPYVDVGNRAEAENVASHLEQTSKTAFVPSYLLATIHAGLGNKSQAFRFLDRAFREHSLDVSWQMKADPRLDNLRSDPRFRNLLLRAGLPD
jgi:TolB-like protein/DNA-binding winged helix-turn-helix (wHTH) protein/Tfp pilus assembly protein PilF